MENQKIGTVNAIASQIPNFSITTPFGDAEPVFSLRGISAVDYSQNQSSPVALFVDEVYKGLGVFTSLQTFDLDRIEVLRGPQGTLYGKNTTGGAVNVYTKEPSLSEGLVGYVTAGYGNLDRREISGASNVPIVHDVVAGRLAFVATEADGFVRNLFPGGKDQGAIDQWAARGSVAFQSGQQFDALLHLATSYSHPTGYGVIGGNIGSAGPGGAGFGTGYTRAGLGFFENQADRNGRLRIRNHSASLKMDWQRSERATLTSVLALDRGTWLTQDDSDGTPFSLLHSDYLSRARALSQDLRIAGLWFNPWSEGSYHRQ